ncbi:DUF6400 family protein [Pseudonocardia sp. H11422]|uniref:DUF6400 family protein n=1 Tax=Pseudonocardia sp. H11422 TaxID=2835866 RepID=UPI001BDD78FE|nr:DUF6400 family protein [Pseudonocardia sp. H11422]
MDPTTDDLYDHGAPLGRLLPEPVEEPGDLPMYRFDLAAHENHRLAAVLAATPDWDPGSALAAETEARRRLYSDLDPEQERIYRMLVEAGVLDA